MNSLVSYYYQVQTLVELTEIFSASLTDIFDRDVQQDPDEIAEELEALEEMIKITSEVRESAIRLVNALDPPTS